MALVTQSFGIERTVGESRLYDYILLEHGFGRILFIVIKLLQKYLRPEFHPVKREYRTKDRSSKFSTNERSCGLTAGAKESYFRTGPLFDHPPNEPARLLLCHPLPSQTSHLIHATSKICPVYICVAAPQPSMSLTFFLCCCFVSGEASVGWWSGFHHSL